MLNSVFLVVCICVNVSSSERSIELCIGVFAHVLVFVGCVESSMEPDIYRKGVELWVLICRGCYSLCR